MKFIGGKRTALFLACLKSSSEVLLASVLNIFFHVQKFGSTSKTKLGMNKDHVAMGIPAKYCEWRWLFNHLVRKKADYHL